MFSSQQDNSTQGFRDQRPQERHPLLRQHPVLFSLCMIGGALLLLIIAGFNANNVFPMFTFIGVSISLPCLLLGIVLGISGILTGIIGILEYFDRPAAAYRLAYQPINRPVAQRCRENCIDTLKSKEHRYDRN